LRDACVDLIVTSPPYFALRSYRDDGEHYEGQVGSEETPGAFVDALIAATAEMVRVLKPTGSIFVNLGDKYAGSGGHNNNGLGSSTLGHHKGGGGPHAERMRPIEASRRNAPNRYNQNSGGIPAKSLMGLPWRYANACVDHLGLILRRDLIWHKPNGLPESVTDRCRSSHEYWFHFTKQGQYFSAIDELREAHTGVAHAPGSTKVGDIVPNNTRHGYMRNPDTVWEHPLGRLPGSVWTIATDPLIIPDWAREKYDLPDHFAAFPQEWPRRIILGWSPSGICTKCGEGRRPVVHREASHKTPTDRRVIAAGGAINGGTQNTTLDADWWTATITGYACACDVPIAPTRPAIVLDPFGGTGTVAMVARALGRTGLNGDLSGDYCRLARWRIYESGHAAKSEQRTWRDAQGAML
jgi:DNA modification methylase